MRTIHILTKIVAVSLIILLAFPLNIISAAEEVANTKIRHDAPDTYIPDFRIVLSADIKDDSGIKEARCYFKQKNEPDFIFIEMTATAEGNYEAILPAPELGSGAIDYFFLVRNGRSKVVRSQFFELKEYVTPQLSELKEADRRDPQEKSKLQEKLEDRVKEEFDKRLKKYQTTHKEGTIQAKTELPKAPSKVSGFSDRIEVVAVEESMRYTVTAMPTIAVTGGGIGLGGIIAGLAVIGGGAALAGGGGGGGGGGGSTPTATLTVSGVWQTHFRCQSDPADLAVMNVTINESAAGSFTGSGNGTDTSGATLKFTLAGSYTSSSHLMSGTLTTTNSANPCVRTDTFSTTLTSYDTGYINMVQSSACGCAGQIRMIKQ